MIDCLGQLLSKSIYNYIFLDIVPPRQKQIKKGHTWKSMDEVSFKKYVEKQMTTLPMFSNNRRVFYIIWMPG